MVNVCASGGALRRGWLDLAVGEMDLWNRVVALFVGEMDLCREPEDLWLCGLGLCAIAVDQRSNAL